MGNDNNIAIQRKKQRLRQVTWLCIIALSEAIGTFLLVFILCTCSVPSLTSSPPSDLLVIVVFGIGLIVIVQVFGKISGAHVNPAITLAAAIFRQIPLLSIPVYVFSQFIGGIFGYGTVLLLIPRDALYASGSNKNVTHGHCTTVPNPSVATYQALLAEYAGTSILIYLLCSFWDRRNQTQADFISLKFGLAITLVLGTIGRISGGSVNPVRTFAPAVFTGVWDRHWIYWLGPFGAAALTAVFYKYVFLKNYNPSMSDQSDMPLTQNPDAQNRDTVAGKSGN